MFATSFATSRSVEPRRPVALWVTLVMGIFAVAWPAEVKAWTGQPLAYVTSANGISVIDTGNNSVVGTIACCSVAAVAPDGKYVYALVPGFSFFRLDISVIDASNDVVIGTIPLNISSVPGALSLNTQFTAKIAASPDGSQLFVATGACFQNMGDCPSPGSQHVAVWLIDIASRSVHAAGSFYGYSSDIAFAPNGRFVYLRDTFDYLSRDCTLSLYPAGSAKSSKDVTLSPSYSSLQGLAISPDSKTAYVRCSPDVIGASDLIKIDTATTTIEKTIPLEPHSFFNSAVNVTPDGKHVYVRATKVVVLDTASDAIVTTVDTRDPSGGGLAITPDGTRVYTANPSKNTVSVIETASNTVVANCGSLSQGHRDHAAASGDSVSGFAFGT